VQLTTGTLGPALRYWLGVGSENKSKSEKGAAAGADGLTWQWEPREATGGQFVELIAPPIYEQINVILFSFSFTFLVVWITD
jgi:hypothetical protein